MPDKFDRLIQDFADCVKRIVVAIGPWKDNDSKFHGVVTPDGIWGRFILAHSQVPPGAR
jgi:hypothetical protein